LICENLFKLRIGYQFFKGLNYQYAERARLCEKRSTGEETDPL
jgi:hypothetical protein